METEITRDTLLVHMTVGQLCDYLRKEGLLATLPAVHAELTPKEQAPRYVYGIRGIMRLFHVSNVTAQRYKRTIIKDAVKQHGRVIVVDADMALRLFNEKKLQDNPFLGTCKIQKAKKEPQKLYSSSGSAFEDFNDFVK